MNYTTLEERLKQINENKQVGIVYKFTSLQVALMIIQTNRVIMSPLSGMTKAKREERVLHELLGLKDKYKGYTCFTRNIHYPYAKGSISNIKTIVRFKCDSDKLSNNNKILPVNFQAAKDKVKELGDITAQLAKELVDTLSNLLNKIEYIGIDYINLSEQIDVIMRQHLKESYGVESEERLFLNSHLECFKNYLKYPLEITLNLDNLNTVLKEYDGFIMPIEALYDGYYSFDNNKKARVMKVSPVLHDLLIDLYKDLRKTDNKKETIEELFNYIIKLYLTEDNPFKCEDWSKNEIKYIHQ